MANTILFILITFVGMLFLARKVGWWLSRTFFYQSSPIGPILPPLDPTATEEQQKQHTHQEEVWAELATLGEPQYSRGSTVGTTLAVIVWGILIAFAIRYLINAFHPALIAKIFGFGAAWYASCPNYGLLAPSAKIPGYAAQVRHEIVTHVPMLTFIAASIVLAFTSA